jgi:hypothetical protein
MEQREIKLVGRGERRMPEPKAKEEGINWEGFTHIVAAAFLMSFGWFLIVFATRAGWILASKMF